MEHLHYLVPPLVHTNFRTSNVVVDESFIAKVSDYGLCKLPTNFDHAGSSSSNTDCFREPEHVVVISSLKEDILFSSFLLVDLRCMDLVLQRLSLSKDFPEKSDEYSFGVFLLELISGRKAHNRNLSNSQENLVFQAKNSNDVLEEFVDTTLGGHEKQAAKKMMRLAMMCLSRSFTRPSMGQIVRELERTQNCVLYILTSYNGQEIGVVTLGSDLFKYPRLVIISLSLVL